MCGIAGFTQFHQQFGDEKTLKMMGDTIIHRGPDAGGVLLEELIGLCHRRLSIIDLSVQGNQPMLSHDGNLAIAFNGEIYNFLEHRDRLEAAGYPFKTHTDTEVILALYEQYGSDCVKYLNGMFAFALWDKKKQTLFLARDRIGKKPLYYYPTHGDVIFASELKAMLALGVIPKKIRLDALYDYFAYQYVPDPKTIFENVFKLEPGHTLTIDKSGIHKEQYWNISFKNQRQADEEMLKKELQGFITDCTTRRMVSDVPLGAFLSGGIDSSGVVATMAKNSDNPITTCSIGFDVKQFNETEFAQIVANRYGTNHHEFTVKQNVKDNLLAIARYFDEPFADPSLVPTYFVSQLARQKVTVAIAGDGGDEIFAGYEKYSTDFIENSIRDLIPANLRKNLFPPLMRLFSRFNCRLCQKAVTLLKALAQSPAMGFYLSNSQITDETWKNLILPTVRQKLGDYHPSSITTQAYDDCDAKDHLTKILYTDFKTYLPGDILVKVDRMSMANSLEVRAPLLDYQLIEFAATLPPETKFRKGEKKILLKEAFKEDLPREILDRKKMGFSVPLAKWLQSELKDIAHSLIFEEKNTGLATYFRIHAIEELWQEHQAGTKDHSTVLWSLLMFQIWWKKYMTPDAEPAT